MRMKMSDCVKRRPRLRIRRLSPPDSFTMARFKDEPIVETTPYNTGEPWCILVSITLPSSHRFLQHYHDGRYDSSGGQVVDSMMIA